MWIFRKTKKKKKGFLTSRFASDPILVQGFSLCSTRYQVTRINEEDTFHKFLNKEKDKKRYDACVDRYVTVDFKKFWFHGESPPQTSPSKLRPVERRKLIHEDILMQHL